MARAHTGEWRFHDDDCWCGAYGGRCNRGGYVWSCCGATVESAECSGPELHPTHWNHPKFAETVNGFEGTKPTHVDHETLRTISPESFPDNDEDK